MLLHGIDFMHTLMHTHEQSNQTYTKTHVICKLTTHTSKIIINFGIYLAQQQLLIERGGVRAEENMRSDLRGVLVEVARIRQPACV